MQKKSISSLAFFNPKALTLVVFCTAACSALAGTLLAFVRSQTPATVSHPAVAGLTFEERVSYQRAIEGVYWRHRIWPRERPDPKPSLDAVMSQAQIARKVTDYLRKSQALEDYWQRPITSEQLQAEMDRMAQHTRQSEVLQELFEALGNDPFVIAECLARSALADRLLTNWYVYDQRIHGDLGQRAEAELRAYPSIDQMKQLSGKYSELVLVRNDSGEVVGQAHRLPNEQLTGGAPALQQHDSTHPLKLNDREWDETAQRLAAIFSKAGSLPLTGRDGSPSRPPVSARPAVAPYQAIPLGKPSSLQEDENCYYTTAVISKANGRLRLATVSWLKEPLQSWLAKAENQFSTEIGVPGGNYTLPTIFGGGCTDNTWTVTAAPPQARQLQTAVWTGSEMIIWGGQSNGGLLDTGGRYNPATDSWTFTNSSGTPTARSRHTAVWTGTEMIVWGGSDQNNPFPVNTGGKYDPASDSWTPTSTTNAPEGRSGHTAVWTGTQMIVWGGNNVFNDLNTGGRYDPNSNNWTATSTTNAPDARQTHAAVWSGSVMIIWGGFDDFNFVDLNTGGRYDPNTDAWTPTTTNNAPDSRSRHTAVWTDSEMIVWGGFSNELFQDLNTGGRYNLNTNTWTATNAIAPDARELHTAVWTGNEMIIWGGATFFSQGFNTGGRYNPGTNTWSATSTINAPDARTAHTAVWSGSEMIVWGGSGGFPFSTDLNTGGRYDLGTNSWTATNTYNVPDPRSAHTAVWTGSEMIVWGGNGQGIFSSTLNTGGRYDLATDSWAPTSITDAPSPRNGQTAVWTGTQMIVWGGTDRFHDLNTGGKYDPGADDWTAMTGIAPLPRTLHTAVWTGSEMIIWGGNSKFGLLNTGGRYNPVTDIWTETSTNAPDARENHTAVWTGGQMIVWGGDDANFNKLNTGGRYVPATNSWTSTSTINAPSARDLHSAVWTAAEMIVWGGQDNNFSFPKIGGRYNPVADTWVATSNIAPDGREGHAAVWTGTQMIVWGGSTFFENVNTGGQYNPVTNIWTATNTNNAPSPRTSHTAVWSGSETGSEMIVWGGSTNNALTNTGASYCAEGAPIPTPTPTATPRPRPTPTPRGGPPPHGRPTPR
jgi:N-acetylneuraminic acid mutarotase